MAENGSTNACNLSHQDEDPVPYIAVSVVHMLVVIVPSITMGAIILCHIRANKELRDPVTTLFCAMTVSCMSFGLLIDLSMIADLPLLGSCSSRYRGAYTAVTYFLRIFIPNQVALIACAQFIVLKYGKKRLTIGKVLAAFGVVTAVAALAGVVIAVPNLYEYTTSAPKIRGSWCVENEVVRRNTIYSSLFLVVIGGVFLIVVCSIRSYLIVKRSTIEADKIVRSVISVNAATLSLEFVSKLPFIVASSLAFVHNSTARLLWNQYE